MKTYYLFPCYIYVKWSNPVIPDNNFFAVLPKFLFAGLLFVGGNTTTATLGGYDFRASVLFLRFYSK